jgi:hypothetical protein
MEEEAKKEIPQLLTDPMPILASNKYKNYDDYLKDVNLEATKLADEYLLEIILNGHDIDSEQIDEKSTKFVLKCEDYANKFWLLHQNKRKHDKFLLNCNIFFMCISIAVIISSIGVLATVDKKISLIIATVNVVMSIFIVIRCILTAKKLLKEEECQH